MNLNQDYKEFLKLLNENGVEFLVVGGYALGFHGYPRYTGDIDIWLNVNERNAERIIKAIEGFGFSSLGLKKQDFLEKDNVIQLGYPPIRIDILTSIDGVEFNEAFKNKTTVLLDNININFIGIQELKKNKKASGRKQDLADLERLDKSE
jgi:hypothetical protein